MVKIENITPGAQVFIERDGTKRRIYLHQLMTRAELDSMEVIDGTVTYSIDEEVLEQKSSEQSQEGKQLNLESTVSTKTTVEVEKQSGEQLPETTETTVEPVIVKPAPRAATTKS